MEPDKDSIAVEQQFIELNGVVYSRTRLNGKEWGPWEAAPGLKLWIDNLKWTPLHGH